MVTLQCPNTALPVCFEFSVLQLCKILARREDITVERMASLAPCQRVTSHSFALKSLAKLGRAPERLRPAPQTKSRLSLRASRGAPSAGRWQFPPRHSLFTRCDRGPVALRCGCGSPALCSSRLSGSPALAGLNGYG